MARKKSDQPTDAEIEILRLLWEYGPSPLGKVCEGLRRVRPVATTTVATVLKIMLDKGLVKRAQTGGAYHWRACKSRESTAGGMLTRLMERVFEELSFTAPDRGGEAVTVDAAFVELHLDALARSADVSRYVL